MIKLTDKQVNEVAVKLDKGFKCFVNVDSGKLIFFPDQLKLPAVDMAEWDEAMAEVEEYPDEYEEIVAMDENQQYGVMEDFATSLDDKKLRDRLYNALDSNRANHNFKFEVENAEKGIKEKWHEFKLQKGMEWVREELEFINERFED
jgi:hypothetical protein